MVIIVIKEKINEKNAGFNGIMYKNDSKDKIVLVFTGIDGGICYANKIAKFYAKNNIPALAIPYFNYKGTPKALIHIPIEYIINVVKYLRDLGYKKIGIDAFSKGTELALNVARITCLDFLILRAPSYFNAEGLDEKKVHANKGCWSYQGKELEYTKYEIDNFSVIKEFIKHKEYNILKLHQYERINDKSIIDTSNIYNPVLLLSSKNDKVWPAYNAALILDSKLSNSIHISFDHLSHFLLPESSFKLKLINKSERRLKKNCKIERRIMNNSIIKFINN